MQLMQKILLQPYSLHYIDEKSTSFLQMWHYSSFYYRFFCDSFWLHSLQLEALHIFLQIGHNLTLLSYEIPNIYMSFLRETQLIANKHS